MRHYSQIFTWDISSSLSLFFYVLGIRIWVYSHIHFWNITGLAFFYESLESTRVSGLDNLQEDNLVRVSLDWASHSITAPLLLFIALFGVGSPLRPPFFQLWHCTNGFGCCEWWWPVWDLSLCRQYVWFVICVFLLLVACGWPMLPFIHGPFIRLLVWMSCFCAYWRVIYSRPNAVALLDLKRRLCQRDPRSVMIDLNLRPCYRYIHYFVWFYWRCSIHYSAWPPLGMAVE